MSDYLYTPDDSTPENMESNRGENPQPINKNQKYAIAALGFLAFMVVGMWMFQFKKNIYSPFEYKGAQTAAQCTGGNCANSTTIADERAKDSDGDGLSDYDEMNVYMTSPYLEDTDSDGFTDREEVISGQNPNCPVGQDCSGSEITNDAAENRVDYSESIDDIMSGLSLNIASEATGDTQSTGANTGITMPTDDVSNKFFTGQITADELRALLLQTGSIDPQTLNQFTDEELMANYAAMMGE